MKRSTLILVLFCFVVYCSKESNQSLLDDTTNVSLSLNLLKTFSLELDNSSNKLFFKEDSDFQHVFVNEITVNFSSVPSGYNQSLTFNPNSSDSQTISLPYGEYNWEIPNNSNPEQVSNFLPVYGQSTQTIVINEPSSVLSLNVNTDYALVTVNDDYTSNVTLTHEDLSISLNNKDGYNYGYVLSGTSSTTLNLIDSNGDNYSTDLGLIVSCKHYKYQLDYSNVGVSSLVCVCDPFEVIERFIVPSSGLQNICDVNELPTSLQNRLRGMWTFCDNADDMSSFSNNGTLNGPSSVQGKFGIDNSAYQFDGNDDFISLDEPFFNGSTSVSSFTFYALIKIDELKSGSSHMIFSKEGYWRTLSLAASGLSDGKYMFSFGGSQPSPQQYISIYSNQEYQVDTWYNLVITYENSELKMYINGELDNSETITLESLDWSYRASGNSTNSNHFGNQFANAGPKNYLKGIIDDLIYWDKALTEDEILMLNR